MISNGTMRVLEHRHRGLHGMQPVMADKGSNMNHASVPPKVLPGMTPPLRLRKWEAGTFGYPHQLTLV